MYFKNATWFVFIFLLVLTLSACGGAPDASPTAAPQVVSTEAAELPEPTAVPDPTETPVPTTEPEPTVVPTTVPTNEPEPTAVPEPVGPTEGPDLILVAQPGLFPEGIEYDAVNGRFLLGSIGEGTIYAVNDDGTFQPFIEDEDFFSTIGLEIDVERNRLLVANTANVFADPSLDVHASLGIYNLTTGERLDMINLIEDDSGGDHFANDIAVDDAGNAYVTDSQFGVFKVDVTGSVSVFAAAEVGITAPNGIVYHPNGYLIVADAAAGSLYKVPVDDPANTIPVEISQPVYGDGMVWHPNGSLIVYDYRAEAVLSLSSDKDWNIATIELTSSNHPASTVAVRGDQIYAVYPHFDELYDGTSPEAFEIVLIEFNK
jgi:hypothetical protein